jgi:hypothetical protein
MKLINVIILSIAALSGPLAAQSVNYVESPTVLDIAVSGSQFDPSGSEPLFPVQWHGTGAEPEGVTGTIGGFTVTASSASPTGFFFDTDTTDLQYQGIELQTQGSFTEDYSLGGSNEIDGSIHDGWTDWYGSIDYSVWDTSLDGGTQWNYVVEADMSGSAPQQQFIEDFARAPLVAVPDASYALLLLSLGVGALKLIKIRGAEVLS